MNRSKVRISGYVQGVGYRYFVYRKARQLGIKGWVRNLANGDVEALFEGDEEELREMIEACRQGPPSAVVESVDEEQNQAGEEVNGFRIY